MSLFQIKLKANSNETLQQTLSSQVTILVFDDDALGMDEKEEKNENNSMDKINRNQFKSRNCRNSNKNIEGTLTDMAIFGCLTKKIMDNSTSIGANSFMSVNEAIQKGQNDSELFTLGIFGKYLCNLGINTVIDRNSGSINEKYVNLSNTILQFIFNGLIFKKKFYLYFSLNEKKNIVRFRAFAYSNSIVYYLSTHKSKSLTNMLACFSFENDENMRKEILDLLDYRWRTNKA